MQTQPTLSQRIRATIGDSFGAAIVEETLEKAIQEARDRAIERAGAPQSTFYDPMSLFMGQDWLSKRGQSLGFADLRRMALNPIIGAIIQTRINQIAAFCAPQQDAYDVGFRIVSDHDDARKDTRRAKEIQDWIYAIGIPEHGEANLETFARKFMRDSLILDQACAEIVPLRNGLPAYTVVVDAATIRKLRASLEYYLPSTDKPWYAQIIDDQIVAEYTQDQMIFGVRNPQSDLASAGYGQSELEILVRTVTTILNTERFNAGLLTAGGTAKGVLVVKGEADKAQFDSFKRDFREAVRNASAYWRPPVLQISKDGDIKWETLDRSNRDMEYGALFEWLIKQACGVYQMDPSEINWSTSSSNSRTTFESRTDRKQVMSQKRGLKPLLTFLANQINATIIAKMDPRYRLEFVGMDRDRAEDAEIREREVKSYRTVNEQREELGLKSLGPKGDVLLSKEWLEAAGLIGKKDEGDEETVDVEDELNQ